MALNKTILAGLIETAIKQIDAEEDDTRKLISEAIADAVVDHITTSGNVTIASGIPVATTGTAAAQTGATTATGTGTIS